MQGREHLTRVRERQAARLDRIKRRVVLASTLGFAALFALAAQHAVGSTKRRVVAPTRQAARVAPASVHFFDDGGDGFAFADPQSPAELGASPDAPPPVAQTSVS